MWITADVNLPDEVIQAHRDGELVLFVGAGASVAKPSGLPLFGGLTEEIAVEAQIEMSEHDHRSPDAFLGRIKDRVDVDARVRELIGRPGSQPNRQHRAIARLAASSPRPRIVTTNYDLHLSRALSETSA